MPGEMSHEEMVQDNAERAYKIEVHNYIMDTVTESIHRHFLTHGTIYADLALLDPINVSRVCDLPLTALQELSKYLLNIDSRETVSNLQCQLRNLAVQWERLKTPILD